LWRYILTELLHGTNRQFIAEWSPASLTVDPWSGVALIVLSAALLMATWMAHRRVGVIAGLRPWQWGATAVPLIAMAFTAVRHVPLAAIWTAPVLALLGSAIRRAGGEQAAHRLALLVGMPALVAVMLTAGYVVNHPRPVIATDGTFLGPKNPCRSVEYLRQHHVAGNLFAPLWWGSYVSWSTFPAIRVSMDGRNISLFPDDMVAANLKFYSRTTAPDDVSLPLRYDTDLLLMPTDAAVLPRIRRDERWRAVYEDSDAVIFVRAGARGVFDDVVAPDSIGPGCSPVLG
jgi:hypothetical protein